MVSNAGSPSFATTRWSVVLAAADARSANCQSALTTLCETYWYPIYAFVRRSGYGSEDARDLTQAFFARLLEKHDLRLADPHRGRFRSFLLSSLKHFLANEWDRVHAQKRGGNWSQVSLELEGGEQRYGLEPVDTTTPDVLYERRWALVVLHDAMRQLQAQYVRDGRQQLFEQLRPFLLDDKPDSYESIAKVLDASTGSLRVAVHRLRRRFASTLTNVIAETVGDTADIDDELRYLLGVLRG